jgi:hypothetical protein
VVQVVQSSTGASRSYVAIIPDKSEIVVTFRGSSNLINWMEDVEAVSVYLNWPGALPDALVHSGFLLSYEVIRDGTKAAIEEARKQCPDCTLHITGHSLGGSQALLASLDLTLDGLKVSSVHTYGCPRTGNSVFAEWWSQTVAPGNSYRVVHYKDIIPHLSPPIIFQHVSRELWQTSEHGPHVLCDGAASTRPRGEDPDCSYQLSPLEYSISDHTAYFGVQTKTINPCAGGEGECIVDGQCADAGKASSCCTERSHKALDCINGRCGCLIDGSCALDKDDCCSQTSHFHLACAGGICCGPQTTATVSAVPAFV